MVFEHPHFQAKKGVEKSRGKSEDFQKNLATKAPRHEENHKFPRLTRIKKATKTQRREEKQPTENTEYSEESNHEFTGSIRQGQDKLREHKDHIHTFKLWVLLE